MARFPRRGMGFRMAVVWALGLVTPAMADTVVLQNNDNSGGYQGTKDSFIIQYNSDDENFGAAWSLHSRHRTAYDYDEESLISFDLASIPSGKTITSAKLTMYYWKDDGSSMASDDTLELQLFRLLKSWTEGSGAAGRTDDHIGQGGTDRSGVAWYLQNAYPDTTQWYNGGARGVNQDRENRIDAALTITGDQYGFYSWQGANVTDTVAYWYAHPEQNFGWVMDHGASSDTNNGVLFFSSEYSTSPADWYLRPKLEITYTPEPTTLALGWLSLLLWIRRR